MAGAFVFAHAAHSGSESIHKLMEDMYRLR
jgi:hypothetical protein